MTVGDVPDVSGQFSASAAPAGMIGPQRQAEIKRPAAALAFSEAGKSPVAGLPESRVSPFIYKEPDDSPGGSGEVSVGLTLRF